MDTDRKARLLVVDDDEQLRELLLLVLGNEGFEVRAAGDAPAALAEVARGALDLVVLDIGLGAGDGREVLAEIRRQGSLPVIMISADGQPPDRVLALRLGADDFLVKPFFPLELVARVESVLRRARPPAVGGAGSSLRIDERTREATVNGASVELTAREFDLLAFLVRSPRQVFSRAQLLEHVWDSRTEWQDEATVTEHVRRVRRKVERDADRPRWIVTVRGVGYRFEP
jgi:DNA-binding response OmpR family regulator